MSLTFGVAHLSRCSFTHAALLLLVAVAGDAPPSSDQRERGLAATAEIQQLDDKLKKLTQTRARIINGTSKVLPFASAAEDMVEGETEVYELPKRESQSRASHLTYTWLQYLTYGAVIKGSCIVGNVMSQLSPYPSVRKFRAKGDTGDFDALPFVTIGFNGLQWCIYGLFAWWVTNNHAFLVLLYANVCGAVAGSWYTLSYHRLCTCEQGRTALLRYYWSCMAIFFVQVLAVFVLPLSHAMFFEGFMASACSIFVAMSPIVCIPTIMRTRCTEAMPVELALVSFLSSVLWLTCGIMLMDWWIIIPNIVGICAGLVAIGLLFTFPRQARPLTWSASEATPLFAGDDGCTGGTPSTKLGLRGSPQRASGALPLPSPSPSPFTAPRRDAIDSA